MRFPAELKRTPEHSLEEPEVVIGLLLRNRDQV